MSIDISSFQDALVPFTALRVRRPRVIWINDGKCREHPLFANMSNPTQWIEQELAYVIPDPKYFPTSLVEPECLKPFNTDRYGGSGLLTNGGGARSAIAGPFQIKGVGKTPLVGQAQDEWHSYGGLNLVDAVLEAINTEVFDRILPHGTVPSYAVIHIGDDTAHMPSGHHNRGPGALLVREACTRPAHFLRAGQFQVREDVREQLLNDVERTRRVNRQLSALLNGHEGVIALLGQFLTASADQFAFARLFRIYHGAISASNIGLDGRWLDLTNTGFVSAGHNFATSPDVAPVYAEASRIESIAREFLYTYTKYHHTEFDPGPLLAFYRARFDEAFAYYGVRLLALPEAEADDLVRLESFEEIVRTIRPILDAEPATCIASPVHSAECDSLTRFLDKLFDPVPREPATGPGWATFLDVAQHAYARYKGDLAFTWHLIGGVIRSLRQAYFSPFFTRTRLSARLLTLTSLQSSSGLGAYIDACIAVSSWLFDNHDLATTPLFSSQCLTVAWNANDGRFRCDRMGTTPVTAGSSVDCAAWIATQNPQSFVIDEFSFLPGVTRILDIVANIEAYARQVHA
jgi:hypothetical protein